MAGRLKLFLDYESALFGVVTNKLCDTIRNVVVCWSQDQQRRGRKANKDESDC